MKIERKVKTLCVFILLILASSFKLFSQQLMEFDNYSRFSINVNGLVYSKTDYVKQSGAYSVEGINALGFQTGCRFNLLPEYSKVGVSVGAVIGFPVVQGYDVTIKHEDIYPTYSEDVQTIDRSYGPPSIWLPILIEYKTRIRKNHYLALSGGLQLLFLGDGSVSGEHHFLNENETEEKVMFHISSEREEIVSPSLLLEIGDYIITKYGRFYIGLNYSKAFNPIMTGEYSFMNLEVSQNSTGVLKHSGDYLALSIRYSWKRKSSVTK